MAARDLGVTVPGDLSVAGFDDIPAAAHTDPPLTTVRQPLSAKGRTAGRPDPAAAQRRTPALGALTDRTRHPGQHHRTGLSRAAGRRGDDANIPRRRNQHQ